MRGALFAKSLSPPMLLPPIGFDRLAGWAEDDHAAAFAAFRRSAEHITAAPPKTRALGVDGMALAAVAHAALAADIHERNAARRFFEKHFVPQTIVAPGFVTGYYEPTVAARRERVPPFVVPLFRRPDDLVEVDEAPPGWDPEYRFARRSGAGIASYFDRAAIEDGALAGRGLELAFVESTVDAFFVHVQGSARLMLEDGTAIRIAFDGKSGHPYTSIGRLAVERGLLAPGEAHKDGLEAWLRQHAEAGRALMRENRSFIFFRETRQAENDGPLGAGGVPLSPGRSLAIDRTLHTMHAPVFVAAPELADFDRPEAPLRRLMIAQDTGSAIVGPARGDLFVGMGAAAGSRAGRIRHAASMLLLTPRPPGGTA
jgi:membrane-bound lytic murein transglycosylase A